jgi:ribose 1,5-bisphosphokinase
VPRGTLVLIVGPSGAGKDTLINYGRRRLYGRPELSFVRRVITRPASQADEDHDTLSEEMFERRVAQGAFAITWRAHGLHYGLPVAFEDALSSGHVVVANVSRSVIADARRRYARTVVTNVTAPQDVLARRLAGGAREAEGSIDERLSRATSHPLLGHDVVTIENCGAIEDAGEKLVFIILPLLSGAHDDDNRPMSFRNEAGS